MRLDTYLIITFTFSYNIESIKNYKLFKTEFHQNAKEIRKQLNGFFI